MWHTHMMIHAYIIMNFRRYFESRIINVDGDGNKKVSCHQYHCYKLKIRDDQSILLHSRWLLQRYVVDMHIKLETTRLDYYWRQQSKIRVELNPSIIDSVIVGEGRTSKVGKRMVLPTSFVGGLRDMWLWYLDAMSLIQWFEKLDFYIKMTCNPE